MPLPVAVLDLQLLQKTVRILSGRSHSLLVERYGTLCMDRTRDPWIPGPDNKIRLKHNLGVERQLTHGDKLPQFYQG